MDTFYNGIKVRRGSGRSRIEVIRKKINTMRRMLLTGEECRWKDVENYQNKIKEFEKVIRDAEKNY
jgi:hypothetical protein